MAAKKCTKKNQGKTRELSFFNERKGQNKIHKVLLYKYYEHDSV